MGSSPVTHSDGSLLAEVSGSGRVPPSVSGPSPAAGSETAGEALPTAPSASSPLATRTSSAAAESLCEPVVVGLSMFCVMLARVGTAADSPRRANHFGALSGIVLTGCASFKRDVVHKRFSTRVPGAWTRRQMPSGRGGYLPVYATGDVQHPAREVPVGRVRRSRSVGRRRGRAGRRHPGPSGGRPTAAALAIGRPDRGRGGRDGGGRPPIRCRSLRHPRSDLDGCDGRGTPRDVGLRHFPVVPLSRGQLAGTSVASDPGALS